MLKFFDKYLLITKKHADYLLFKQAVNLVLNKEHITLQGLKKIDFIRGLMNRGLPSKLVESVHHNEAEILRSQMATDLSTFVRPLVPNLPIPAPQWLAGFSTAEGCFFVVIYKSKSSKLGVAVQLKFILVQHIRDEQLMISIKEYFECGNILIKRETVHWTVSNFIDLTNKIIPFFKKHPILGTKAQDFTDWCKVADLIQNEKAHLTSEGLDRIREIKSGMNKGRK